LCPGTPSTCSPATTGLRGDLLRLWRPESAIHEAGNDGNDGTTPDASWQPLSVMRDDVTHFSPNFPAYTSGHATFGAAHAAAMKTVLGDDNITFTATTDDPHAKGVSRTSNLSPRRPWRMGAAASTWACTTSGTQTAASSPAAVSAKTWPAAFYADSLVESAQAISSGSSTLLSQIAGRKTCWSLSAELTYNAINFSVGVRSCCASDSNRSTAPNRTRIPDDWLPSCSCQQVLSWAWSEDAARPHAHGRRPFYLIRHPFDQYRTGEPHSKSESPQTATPPSLSTPDLKTADQLALAFVHIGQQCSPLTVLLTSLST
jgi:hypothetical protein